jgi:hypothetical protein
MKQAYLVLRNALIFFFIVSVVGGIAITGAALGKILLAVFFGILMMIVPSILQFFKINVNTGSKLLMSIVLSFLFFFLLYTGLGGVTTFSAVTYLDLGLGAGSVIVMEKVGLLIFLSLVSALASVGMDRLSKG